ncbi:MAG: DUF5060 domain-containing protein [Verrucomicrobiota bacterium]
MIPLVPVSDKEKSVIATLFLALLALPAALSAAPRTENLQLVPKWGRFERSFTSSRVYADPPGQAALTVVFISPLGETIPVYGFWDGGRIWRVRFSPGQPGRWSFSTLCSDTSNEGLQDITGAFLCTAPDAGQSRFNRHGPVRVARDHRHFEHADGTPFFWLADSAWEGARRSNPGDWETYARIRAAQKFSAVQWAVDAGGDEINPEFFKSFDAKVEALNHAGLLSVIAPFSGTDPRGAGSLPENRLAVLLRYMVARWAANDVAWLLTADGSDPGNAAVWKQAGRAVFGPVPHAPVILRPGADAFDRFRNEHWVDAWGYVLDTQAENPLLELLSSPLASEWTQEPVRPSINIQSAPENRLIGGRRVTADEARRGVWCSLLIAPPAGVGYCAEGVFNWNTAMEPTMNGASGGGQPSWRNALDLPGARQMAIVADVFNSIDFWRLSPASQLAIHQPGSPSPRRNSIAAATDAKDLEFVYVPVDRTAELSLASLPGWPTVTWINPRTGEKSAAVAVVQDSATEFPTPEPGDWLLTIKAGK